MVSLASVNFLDFPVSKSCTRSSVFHIPSKIYPVFSFATIYLLSSEKSTGVMVRNAPSCETSLTVEKIGSGIFFITFAF